MLTELDRNLTGWFGKKKRSKQIIKEIITKLAALQKSADIHDEEIRRKTVVDGTSHVGASFGFDVEKLHLKADAKKSSTQKE